MDSAEWLVNATRWLGVLIAAVGAVSANPEATLRGLRDFWTRVRHWGRQTRGFLARFLPFLRRHVVVRPNSGSMAGVMGLVTASARGIIGWAPDATVDEKIELLDNRTRRMDKEIGELQLGLNETEKKLRRELGEAVVSLRSEADEIRSTIEALRDEIDRTDASALPIIVLGVALTGLAPDAKWPPIWLTIAILLGAVALTVFWVRRIWLEWRDREARTTSAA